MTLQHKLRVRRCRVPKLNSAVLRSGKYPLSIRSKCDTQNEVLMALERLDTLSTARARAERRTARGGVQLPHLDSLIERARDEIPTVRREGNTVHTVPMTIRPLEAFDEVPCVGIPNAHTLVQRTSSNQFAVGGDGDGGNAVLDAEGEDVLTGLDIPDSHSSVAGARRYVATVTCEVEGVDVLFVAVEGVTDHSVFDIPNLCNVRI